MKRLDTYRMHKEIHRKEVHQLKDAVAQFGGEIHFGLDYSGEYASGTERPIVAVNISNWDCGPMDVYINAVKICDNRLHVLAETKEGMYFALETDDIMFGHVSFITDLVPVVDEKDSKDAKEYLILETAVFMSWDMFNKMYNPEKGMGQFEVCHKIIELAREFENTCTYKVDDKDYDEGKYFDELMAFEDRYLEEINS